MVDETLDLEIIPTSLIITVGVDNTTITFNPMTDIWVIDTAAETFPDGSTQPEPEAGCTLLVIKIR
jgi:hypothetical protein